jgi:prevent-host-death family protein
MPRRGSTKRIPRVVTALTARTQLGQILRRVRKDKEKFVIEKRGEAQAIVICVEEYLRLFDQPVREFEAIRREAKGLDQLTLRDTNREIKRYRRERQKKD